MFHKLIRWMTKHHVSKQFQKRLNTKTFFGLPFTILVVLTFIVLLVLFGMIQNYLAHGSLIDTDIHVANLLFAFRNVSGIHFFYFITLFASSLTATIIMVYLIFQFFWQRQWIKGMIVFVGLVATEGLTAILKFFFHRTRPDLFLRAVNEDSFSFPSGHATTAVFIFGFIAYQTIQHFKSKKLRCFIVLLTVIFIILIDLSRMYLGVHFLSDVIAGNIIGLLGLFLIIGIDQWCIAQKKYSQLLLSRTVLVGSVVLAIVTVILTFIFGLSP